MDKTILAVNGSKKCPTWERIIDSIPPFLMLFINVTMIYILAKMTGQEDATFLTLAFPMASLIYGAYMFVFVLDNHIRLFHAQETVLIHGNTLVIDCPNSFLRRYKSIPLSSIDRIEPYNGSRGSSLTVPDTLRVYHGRTAVVALLSTCHTTTAANWQKK